MINVFNDFFNAYLILYYYHLIHIYAVFITVFNPLFDT